MNGPQLRTIAVRVSDGTGRSAIEETSIDVLNVAPGVDAGPDLWVGQGKTWAVSGAFTDPGPDSWTATVDYDDGAGPQALSLAGKAFNLDYAYNVPGLYFVTITVTDDDGAVGSDVLSVTVLPPIYLPLVVR
jgi:hypothetical protein